MKKQMSEILNGKELAKIIRENLKLECEEMKKQGIIPKLAVIMVGDDPASKIYVKNKSKAAEDIGVEYEEYILKEDIKQKELIDLIKKLNNDNTINGILLQSPIPKHLDIDEAFRTISEEKDVDGFNPINLGKLLLNQDTFVSCTPYGIMKLFEHYNITIVRTPRFAHDSLEFLASSAIFARSGHIKHSVLPEPVPVDTNRFSPLVAASSADIW